MVILGLPHLCLMSVLRWSGRRALQADSTDLQDAMSSCKGRIDLTASQWSLIQPLLSPPACVVVDCTYVRMIVVRSGLRWCGIMIVRLRRLS